MTDLTYQSSKSNSPFGSVAEQTLAANGDKRIHVIDLIGTLQPRHGGSIQVIAANNISAIIYATNKPLLVVAAEQFDAINSAADGMADDFTAAATAALGAEATEEEIANEAEKRKQAYISEQIPIEHAAGLPNSNNATKKRHWKQVRDLGNINANDSEFCHFNTGRGENDSNAMEFSTFAIIVTAREANAKYEIRNRWFI